MSDLLAKCDWHGDELHVYTAEWPEVVYVWVDEKTMPYAPVVADVRSLQAENAKLRELACHMLTCIRYMESPAFDENGCRFCKYDGKRVCNFEERMKALGIEAEE